MPKKPKKEKIIVIGAGISGLAAARSLVDNGNYEVLVVEARDRIGGRIWTDRNSLGVPIDLGASWIHGKQKNPLYAFATQHKISLLDTDSKSRPDTFHGDGTKFSAEERDRIDFLFRKTRDMVYDIQEERSQRQDMALGKAFELALRKQKLSKVEEQGVRHLISTEVENEYAAVADKMSLRYWDTVNWFKGADMLLPDGYDRVLGLIAQGLNIVLNSPVKAIKHDRFSVQVVTIDGVKHKADRAIITLPLGVLKSGRVKFEPELPGKKLKAIDELEMGTFDKLYLRFSERFWSESATWIEYLGPDLHQWPLFLNLASMYKEPILVAFNVGEFARSLETKSDSEILGEAMSVLRKIYGAGIAAPIASKVTRWSSDPYAGGSYSFLPVNKKPCLFEYLQQAIDLRLFFAGEATDSKDYSSAHAAYASGLRAADEVIAATG